MNYETGSFTEGRLAADGASSSRKRWVIGAVLALLLAIGVWAFARRGEQPPAAGAAAVAASGGVITSAEGPWAVSVFEDCGQQRRRRACGGRSEWPKRACSDVGGDALDRRLDGRTAAGG